MVAHLECQFLLRSFFSFITYPLVFSLVASATCLYFFFLLLKKLFTNGQIQPRNLLNSFTWIKIKKTSVSVSNLFVSILMQMFLYHPCFSLSPPQSVSPSDTSICVHPMPFHVFSL